MTMNDGSICDWCKAMNGHHPACHKHCHERITMLQSKVKGIGDSNRVLQKLVHQIQEVIDFRVKNRGGTDQDFWAIKEILDTE